MPEEISDKTTARSFTQSLQGLSKFGSIDKYNSVLNNWTTIIKYLREIPGSWIKWNMTTKPVETSRYKIIFYEGLLVILSLRDSVGYVVDPNGVSNCSSFNRFGNEQMKSDFQQDNNYKVSDSKWIDFLCTNKGAHSTNGNTEEITLRFSDYEKKINGPVSLGRVRQHNKTIDYIVDQFNRDCYEDDFILTNGAVYSVVEKDQNMDTEAKETVIPVSFRPISFSEIPQKVCSFYEEGFHYSNFFTLRTITIVELKKSVDTHQSLLVASTPFTGKTSLSLLLHNSLLNSSSKSCLIRLSDYTPRSQSLEEFVNACTGLSLEQLLNPKTSTYLIFDEFQKTYPNTPREVVDAYFFEILAEQIQIEREAADARKSKRAKTAKPAPSPEDVAFDFVYSNYRAKIDEIITQHTNLHTLFKTSLSNQNFKLIAFSSYGDQKAGSDCSTPYTFGCKQTKYAYFSDAEMNEILKDFTRRSQLLWFKTDEHVQFLRDYLAKRTLFHIGFVSSILGDINLYPKDLSSLDLLHNYLVSPKITVLISTKRATPSQLEFLHLKQDVKDALVDLLRAGRLSLEQVGNRGALLSLVKKGWVNLADSRISFPCPLSKDVFYARMFQHNRPEEDNFTRLEDFVEYFLSQLRLDMFKNTLSASVESGKPLLEIFWCHELYRIGYTILRKDTYLSGEVQELEGRRAQGKIDFIVKNGNRAWAIEFLICGDQKLDANTTHADEHLNRFRSNSKYANFKNLEYLVVDFRPGKGANKQKTDSDKLWLVYYDSNNDYEMNLVRLNQELKVIKPC